MVQVIAGNDNGKTGKVLRVYPENDRVLVEGVNVRIKHEKPSQDLPQGGRIEREIPLHVSNVMPLDPSTNEPTRIGRKRIEEDGKSYWVRYSKISGEILDK